jgi:hypothetical protein
MMKTKQKIATFDAPFHNVALGCKRERGGSALRHNLIASPLLETAASA